MPGRVKCSTSLYNLLPHWPPQGRGRVHVSASCPSTGEHSWTEHQVTQFSFQILCAIFKPLRERGCTQAQGSRKHVLPFTAGSPAKDTNHQSVGQIQCPLNQANVGPTSIKSLIIMLHWLDCVDNKIHKPLHPQAHKSDLPFLNFSL